MTLSRRGLTMETGKKKLVYLLHILRREPKRENAEMQKYKKAKM